MDILDQPMIRAIWPALLVALIAGAVLLRLAGARAAGVAVGLGFLISAVLIVGFPGWPPNSAQERLLFATAGLTLVGFVLDLLRMQGALLRTLIGLLITVALVWVTFPVFRAMDWLDIGLVLVLAIVAASLVPTLEAGPEQAGDSAAVLAVLAGGVAALTLLGGSASGAELAGGLAAAFAGWGLLTWPAARAAVGGAVLMGGGGAIFLLAAATILFGSGDGWAFLVLPFVFVAPRFARALPLPRGAAGRVVGPVATALVALMPVLAGFGIASLTGGGGYGY
jgi:hypothetical protein